MLNPYNTTNMPTRKDVKQTCSQVMELKDLISAPLAATIDADSIATCRYLKCLMELAFDSYDKRTGRVGDLRMLEFTYMNYDVDGNHLQRVRIPLLTLVPLPLLQVKEADFDFDIQIVDAVSSDADATFSLKNNGLPKDQDTAGVRLRVTMASVSTKSGNVQKNNFQQSLTANMKVRVRMEQADMPGGLANLLHLTTNNLQMETFEEEKEDTNDE